MYFMPAFDLEVQVIGNWDLKWRDGAFIDVTVTAVMRC